MDLDFDRDHIWHPYTSLVDPLPVYPVSKAYGCKIVLEDGRELTDGMASWWAAIHGYNVPEINRAAQDQLGRMSHVMFGGLTHQPAIDLATKLLNLAPDSMDKVFFSDSGSVSVDVALKMALQYQHSLGKNQKKKFMTFRKGYHGDTIGPMAVCDPVSGMHSLFQGFLPEHHFLAEPAMGKDVIPDEQTKKEIEDFFHEHHEDTAAFILEPVVQGAGSMRIYSPEYLKIIRRHCDQYGILMIADEIATGFGRTGKLFAVEHAEIDPDIMCVGKALTGGYMTLAATLCSDVVARGISRGEAGVFMHGPTFMANPLACAIAGASLDLLLQNNWGSQVSRIERILNAELNKFEAHHQVSDIRVLGAIGVIETKKSVDVKTAQEYFVSQHVWIRPFRNLLYIMPPYVIGEEDLLKLCDIMGKALDQNVFIN